MNDETGAGTALADQALAADIVAAVDALHDDTIELLSAMVREPSTLGREQGVQRVMADAFAGLGLEVDAFEIDERAICELPGYSPALIPYDGRGNVVGIHRPTEATGRSLIFNGHVDVVPAGPEELWATPPFEPSIRDGRMYGRGAGDMKSGVAAYVAAFSALSSLGLEPAAPVYLQSVIEEEGTGNGALACLARGYRADAAVIPEPFDHTLTTAQVGVAWLVLEVTGWPAHVLDTSAGANAIEAVYRLNEHLKRLEERWNRPESRHPAFRDHAHPINFNLGRIAGGEWTSSVPTRCTAEFRLGFYPGVSTREVRAAAERLIDEAMREDEALAGFSVKITWRGFQAEGCVVDPGLPMMELLRDAHRVVRHDRPADIAITCTTDIRFFNLYGDTPSTCYGPQGGGFHGIDEWVSLDSLRDTARVLALFLAAWCGVERRPA